MSVREEEREGPWIPAGARADKPLAEEPARPDWSPPAAAVKRATGSVDERAGASDAHSADGTPKGTQA